MTNVGYSELANVRQTQPIRAGPRMMLRVVVQLSPVGQAMRNYFSGIGEAQD